MKQNVKNKFINILYFLYIQMLYVKVSDKTTFERTKDNSFNGTI